MLPGQIAQMKTDMIKARARASLPEIRLVASKIGPINADTEVELERWQAEILAEWGIVDWPRDSESLLLEAYAARDRDQSGRTIEPIADPFHIFPGIVSALEREGLLTQKMVAVRTLFEDLIPSRTNKVTRAARMGQDPGDSLGPEELWLYRSLRKVFDEWRRETKHLLEPRGTVDE